MAAIWKTMTPYQLLEVGEKASGEEIKRAWELQRIAWHPDRFPAVYASDVTERFTAIKNAYETLSNPALRKRLDLGLGVGEESAEGAPAEAIQFELPEQHNPDCWKRLAKWAKDEDKLSGKSRFFAYSVADKYLEKSRALSQAQLNWAKNIWTEAIREGFDPGADE